MKKKESFIVTLVASDFEGNSYFSLDDSPIVRALNREFDSKFYQDGLEFRIGSNKGAIIFGVDIQVNNHYAHWYCSYYEQFYREKMKENPDLKWEVLMEKYIYE